MLFKNTENNMYLIIKKNDCYLFDLNFRFVETSKKNNTSLKNFIKINDKLAEEKLFQNYLWGV